MATRSPASRRAFVRRHTRLLPVADVPGLRLQQAEDVTTLWRQAGRALGQVDPALPFWAFPWSGGLALARYLVDHPEGVAGRRVLDIASGSGLCAIVALRSGAASAHAADVDPFSAAAIAINARANGVRIGVTRGDLLTAPPPPFDVILAGDVCYEETMASRMVAWLRIASDHGARVLLGDPGRTYLPRGLLQLASYQVRTSREIEDPELKEAGVFTFGG
ncbi:MAG TPA: 50S ribosomal protein L11 methyltransferase [Candidatus Limnocylindrales bacterium]